MLEKLAEVESRYFELERLMGDPEIAADYARIAELAKERSSLQDIVDAYGLYRRLTRELDDAKELLASADDAEMRELAGAWKLPSWRRPAPICWKSCG